VLDEMNEPGEELDGEAKGFASKVPRSDFERGQ
jgi:hypothetical protein